MGLITGGGVGDVNGDGEGEFCGPPGMALGTGEGEGTGGKYAARGRNHSWNGWSPMAGARYAMPLPSGAHVGWATIWSLITIWRAPRLEPENGAITRYE